ncbi:RHS repeat-associated core domain-containing protein [Nocardioides terrigena]|uniref:RHS repeat-associated core domain-containing protein n=1 Tax=Nocardioides terrigena TaxID=424797 RepID=UPI00131ED4B8|nr:RHS repeat-associated core domain-containing protein [Nocardioides terrigena]
MGGLKHVYAQPAGWPLAARIPLIEVVDRHGNRLRYSYDGSGRVQEVRDDDDRFLHFEYGDCGLLERVLDHAGRSVVYWHDPDIEHLVEVVDTDGVALRHYRYDKPWLPEEMRHNIVEVVSSDGDTLVLNTYEEDPASWSWGRVTLQVRGEFAYQYRYTQLQSTPRLPEFRSVPAVRVEVLDPELAVTTSTFNGFGDLLDHRLRLVRDGSFRVVVHQFDYDEAGNRTMVRYPDGREEHRTYDHASADPRRRSLLLRREVRARTGFPDPSRIMWRGTYEPAFQLPRSVTDEDGNVTRYLYDLDAGTPGATGRLSEIRLPDATLDDGSAQSSTLWVELNVRGQCTAVVTAEGTRTELHYGTSGHELGLLSEVHHDVTGLDLVERFRYDPVGDVVAAHDATGGERRYAYDSHRRVRRQETVAVAGARAAVTIDRDADGDVVGITRPAGDYTDPILAGSDINDSIHRDPLGNVLRTVLAANTEHPRAVTQRVDYRGMPVSVVDALGTRVTQQFDERGMLLHKDSTGSDGTSLRETSVYDTSGRRVIHRTGPAADLRVDYTYDGFGRLSQVSSANGSIVEYEWGRDDLLVSESVTGDRGDGTAALLRLAAYDYDERGRLTKETVAVFADDPAAAVDSVTTYRYDGDNNRTAVTDPRGATTIFVHDALGRLVERRDAVGNATVHTYSGLDRLTRVERRDVTPAGVVSHAWEHAFDERGRRVRSTDPLGNSTVVVYDDRDVPVAVTSPLGVVQRRVVGPTGELMSVTRDELGLQVVHVWAYDAAGRLETYVDPAGEVTTMTYDGVGRQLEVTRPGFSSSRSFGADGRLAEEVLASGARVRMTYDAAGRLHSVDAQGGGLMPVPLITYTYDGLDRLVGASTGSSTTTRAYDSLGRLVSEGLDGVSVDVSHDDTTGQTELSWPSGRRERITTADNGFPVRVERLASGSLGDGPAVLAEIEPAGLDRYDEVTVSGELTAEATYDLGGRLTRLAYESQQQPVESFDYRFDADGRRGLEQAVERDAQRLWEHDGLDRVDGIADDFALSLSAAPGDQAAQDAEIATAATTAVGSAARWEHISYNDGDERVARQVDGVAPVAYSHLPGHRLSQAGPEPVTHQADGIRETDGGRRYVADALGRIRAVQRLDGTAVFELDYDALGRPVVLGVTGSTTTQLHYLGDRLLLESRAGAAVREYSPQPVTGAPLLVHVAGRSLTPVVDLSGSVRGYWEPQAGLVESHEFDPFGTPTMTDAGGTPLTTSNVGLEPSFAGMRWLPEAGLYLTRSRLYDPRHGAFLSPDPAGASDSPNPYAYVRHDPADLVDPRGELAFLAVLGIVAIGALVGGGLNAVRQGIAISEGAQEEFSWGELGLNMAIGGVLAPVAVFAPEIAIPLAAMGVSSGAQEISRGHYATGLFDIGTSIVGLRGATRSPSFLAPRSVRITNAKVVIARTDLNQAELGLHLRRVLTTNPETRASLQRQIGDVRIARAILDDPGITVRSLDPETRSVTERPLGFDPSELGWDGIRRDVQFYRPDGTRGGDLDISLPRLDVEIKLGERAGDTAGKVDARNTFLPERAGTPYVLASEIPPDVLGRWQQHPRAVPIDLRTAANHGFDGHLQVTPEMRGGTPYFLRDLLSPEALRYVFPSVGTGRK